MIEIQVNNLVKSFEVGHNVLDGVTFQIDQGQRVGLLGKNGAGKSTLFKILIGELDCDEGTVTISPGHRMGLISQIPVYPEGYTVDDVLRSAFGRLHALTAEMEELAGRMAAGETDPAILKRYGSLSERFEVFGGYDTDVAISKVANGLSISDDMRGRLFDQLSGGEKTRVNLGRLILEDTDILLLDEPTNHLDLHATEWLEAYIQKFRGTVVAISHDRYFLDRSVNRVIEIENGKAEFYSGNYSFYAVEKERRYQERMKQYEKEQAKIAQLEKSAEQLRMWAFQGMDKTYRRAISMERRIERMRTTAKPTKARKMDARFTAAEFHGDEVLGIRSLSKSFGEKKLFEGISLKVEGGERIALIGDNGTGKSTLIKMIVDEVYPDSGRIRLGPQVKLAYLPQIIHFDHPDWNLVENMMAAKRGISAQSARNRLAAYDFRGEDVLKPGSVLSGGGRGIRNRGENMRDVLCIYYSRTGNTKRVMETIAKEMDAELLALTDGVERSGLRGWLRSGMDAMRKDCPDVLPFETERKLENYRLVIVGTPVWAGRCSSVIRSFLKNHGGEMKRVAYVLTRGSEHKSEDIYRQMDQYTGKPHQAATSLRVGHVGHTFWQEEFLRQIRELLAEEE